MRRLAHKRGLRWSEGVCVLEGPDLIEAALAAGAEFEGVFVDAALAGRADVAALLARCQRTGVRTYTLAEGVLARVAESQSPQPVIAAVRFAPRGLTDLAPQGLVLVLHEVRDPGNAGSAIRAADAAGASAVVLSGDSVDPYNPKTLRASAGSIFHVPVAAAGSLLEVTQWFEGAGPRYACVVRGGEDYRRLDLSGDCLVVLGNESAGLTPSDVALADASLSIPMAGPSESLNVSVAAGVVLFEALTQRGRRGARLASGDHG